MKYALPRMLQDVPSLVSSCTALKDRTKNIWLLVHFYYFHYHSYDCICTFTYLSSLGQSQLNVLDPLLLIGGLLLPQDDGEVSETDLIGFLIKRCQGRHLLHSLGSYIRHIHAARPPQSKSLLSHSPPSSSSTRPARSKLPPGRVPT